MVRAAEKKEMENRRRFPAVFEGHDRLRNILVRNRRTSQKKKSRQKPQLITSRHAPFALIP